jgi:capsid protein
MSKDNQLISLYDGAGNIVTQFNPKWNDVKREIAFGSQYNPDSTRRGSSGGIYANASSESWVKNRDRIKQMMDARDQCQFSWIGGMIGRVCRYVVGRLHCKSETGDEAVDSAYDSYFHRWSGEERNDDGTTSCDITGRHRFLKMVQMAFVAHIVDGDYGFIEIAPQFSPTAQMDASGMWIPGTGGFCLQSIESDRIGSPMEGVNDETYIGGVKIDPKTGRVLYYRIFNRSRTVQYTPLGEIEPADFIHLHDFERSDEYRGRTKLLRSLNDLRDIREALTAEMMSAKTQSQFSVMVGVKDPFSNQGPAAWSGKTDAGTPTQDALYGKILKMSEGENFSMMAPAARPSGAFMNLIDTLIRKLAISLELSYGMVWNLATLGGASQRIETEADNLKIQTWQELLKDYLLIRVRNKVIAQGIANKELPPHPNWKRCNFRFGKAINADLGYEMEADIKGVQMGILELDKVVSKHTGMSASEVNKSNLMTANAFITNSAESGIPVETVAKGIFPQITAERAAFLQSQAPPPPPAPLSIQNLTDKGIKPLVEIMEKVGDGTIDRESAIHAVMKIYEGLSRADAEKIIPDEPAEEDLNRAAGLTPSGEHAPVAAGPKTSSSSSSKSKAVSTSRK